MDFNSIHKYIFTVQANQKNIRLVVMNNLLPSGVKMHLKFDLKGSTYKRKASKHEKEKKSPTFKDLDYLELLPEGVPFIFIYFTVCEIPMFRAAT